MSAEESARRAPTGHPGVEDTGVEDPGAVGLVDWVRTAKRVRTSVTVLAGTTVAVWLVTGLLGAGFGVGRLASYAGIALGVLFLVEVVVVGGAAFGGMLRAGARGERLSSEGVGLLPPRPRIPTDPRRAEEGPEESGRGSADG